MLDKLSVAFLIRLSIVKWVCFLSVDRAIKYQGPVVQTNDVVS